MKDLSEPVAGSPFAEIQKLAFEFGLNMQEEVLFNELYSEKDTREAAINYLITSPKMQLQKPN